MREGNFDACNRLKNGSGEFLTIYSAFYVPKRELQEALAGRWGQRGVADLDVLRFLRPRAALTCQQRLQKEGSENKNEKNILVKKKGS
jgi:hypothetical protein